MQNNNSFKIVDSERTNLPIIQTDYYQWLLKQGKTDIHSTSTKLEYLAEQGFKFGVDSLSTDDYLTLSSIEQGYFQFEIKPTLRKPEL